MTTRGVNFKKNLQCVYEKHAVFLKNIRKSKVDSEQSNTARIQTPRRLTLHGVVLGPIFSLQASPCPDRENYILKKYMRTISISQRSLFTLKGLACQKIQISSQKLIYKRNYFNLFIRVGLTCLSGLD